MRFLSVDVGDKRTGFAAGDDFSGVVTPLGVAEIGVTVGGDLAALVDAVAEAALEADVDTVAIGLPLNMDGTAGPRAAHARAVAVAVHKGLMAAGHLGEGGVVLVDERQTSEVADSLMARTGMTRGQKKKKRDALAAVAIGWVLLERGPTERIAPE